MSIDYVDKGFRDELINNISNPVKVHEICLKLLSEVARITGINTVVKSAEDGWVVINRLIEISGEFVLARFYAENTCLGNKLPVNGLVVDMMIRDSITCMEKIRSIALALTPVGKQQGG